MGVREEGHLERRLENKLSSEWDLNPAQQVPEIQRCDLLAPVLQLKALGVDNIMQFDWLATPPAEAMVRALEHLYALGALDDNARFANLLRRTAMLLCFGFAERLPCCF